MTSFTTTTRAGQVKTCRTDDGVNYNDGIGNWYRVKDGVFVKRDAGRTIGSGKRDLKKSATLATTITPALTPSIAPVQAAQGNGATANTPNACKAVFDGKALKLASVPTSFNFSGHITRGKAGPDGRHTQEPSAASGIYLANNVLKIPVAMPNGEALEASLVITVSLAKHTEYVRCLATPAPASTPTATSTPAPDIAAIVAAVLVAMGK